LAVVRRLQDNWPDVRITWIIGKTEASLMTEIDDVEFIIFDKSAGRKAYRTVKDALRGRSFDVALCMHASFRANWLYRLIDTPRRIGFDRQRAKDFQWLFTSERIPHQPKQHALEAMLAFASAIGAHATPLRWDFPVDASKVAGATSGPTVVISPCSSSRARNFRNWPVDHYIEIVRYIVEDKGAAVVLTGGPTDLERTYGKQIAEAVPVTNLIGRTSLTELLAWLDAAQCVICPDSGPAHMATMVATPVIGLYATSDPRRTGPYLSQSTVVNRYPDAARRFLGKTVDELRWGQRIRDKNAMLLVEIDDVREKIDGILG
jgi:heptosyltransferase I